MKKQVISTKFHWKPLLSLLIVLPAVILSYYGIRLYDQFPQWCQRVNEQIGNDPQKWISPTEAQFLIESQKLLQDQSLYLSVDSLIERNWVQSDSFVYIYDYSTGLIRQKFLQKGASLRDGKYIVNSKKSTIGLTHDQTGYLLMLQAALELLDQKTNKAAEATFFNGNLAINDIIINERVSIISYDKTGKYLIQLSSRLPDLAYANNNNKVAMSQSVFLLMQNFVKYSWMILLSTLITLFLYRNVQSLSMRGNRLLKSLNKATCAIVVSDAEGKIAYNNDTFRDWNDGKQAEGENIRSLSNHPQLETTLQKVLENPGQTEYYYGVLGSKSVHTGITYDAETESLILVDNDFSAIRNMYDRELHSLKNLIQEVKELTGSIILGKIDINDTEKTLSTLQYNNHTLEKALLFYQNQRYFIGGGYANSESSNYDLELGLDYIVQWFHSLLAPLNIEVKVEVQGLEIKGSLSTIELIFHNAIFNAIQAIREKNRTQETAFIHITAQKMEGNILVEIIDNGIGIAPHENIDDLILQSRGNGLQIIQSQIGEMVGKCLGFRQIDAETKALQLIFKR
jgi:hypothetical protein